MRLLLILIFKNISSENLNSQQHNNTSVLYELLDSYYLSGIKYGDTVKRTQNWIVLCFVSLTFCHVKLDLMLPGFSQSSHSFLVFAMLERVMVIWRTGRSPITQTSCRGLHLDPLRTKNKD